MTNQNDPHPDALSALENFASGKPAQPAKEDSVDASGFVGMLARGTTNEADPAGSSSPPPPMQRPMPTVSPKAIAPPAPSASQLSAAIPVAKEIIQPQPQAAAPQDSSTGTGIAESLSEPTPAAEDLINQMPEAEPTAPAAPVTSYRTPPGRGAANRSRRRVPHWYHTAVPISLTLGGLLALIGIWSLLAVISHFAGSAFAPGFDPGVAGDLDRPGDSVIMPLVLLLSLPVGVVLEVMAVIMMKQLKRQAAIDEAEG